MTTLKIFADAPLGIDPKTKGSMKHIGKGRMVEDNRLSKTWRAVVAFAARQAAARARWVTTKGPVRVAIDLTLPRPASNRDVLPIKRSSGDVDKHSRNILDALDDAGVYADDSQVVSLHIDKKYIDAAGVVGAVITVTRLDVTR